MNAERLMAHYERIADAPNAISRLRRFVLDLAMRGKLVPQDAIDEPAWQLLKRIAAERARLVKAGEIRMPKALPVIDQPPYAIPKSWHWSRMRDVTSDRGQTVPAAPFSYIDVTAINKEAGVVAEPTVLDASEAPSRARKIIRVGDVIYSCVRPYLLNVAVIEEELDPAPIASTAFAVLNGYGLVLARYLWIVLRSPFMVTCVEETQRGQAYPAINDADFAVLPVPLPPLAEQHRIVAKVDELMALCDRLEAARGDREAARDRLAAASLARLNNPDPDTFANDARFAINVLPALTTRGDQIKQLRRTILNLAVTGKLVQQHLGEETIDATLRSAMARRAALVKEKKVRRKTLDGSDHLPADAMLPSSWRLERLGNLVDPENTISYGVLVPGDEVSNGVPFVRAQDLALSGHPARPNKTISPEIEQAYARTRLRGGEILVCVVGSIGKLGIVPPSWAGANIARAVARIMPIGEISSDYLLIVLRSEPVQRYFKETTRTLAQPTLNVGLIEQAPIPLPSLAEQHRIVAKVDELMAACDRLEASLDATNATRRRLLDALLAEALAPVERGEMELA